MKKAILAANLLIAAIFISGCATIVTGTSQIVTITSNPPGAIVSIDDGTSITTPGVFKLTRNQCYTLTAEYPGAEPQIKELKQEVQGWFWGNILMLSGTGCAVDLTSGGAYKLTPSEVNFDFTKAIEQIRLASFYPPYVEDLK